MFTKGDKVFDIRFCWGVVVSVDGRKKYGVSVLFMSGEPVCYDMSGRDYENDGVSMLRHYEYELKKTV
jgi:hypothetical protein